MANQIKRVMKELSIEEKAKAYDKIMGRAKKELDACGSLDCDAARQIFRLFPALAKGEDERIRKEIVDFINIVYERQALIITDEERDNWITWLEKQRLTDDEKYQQGILDDIFSELAESEDERIRKAVHIYLDWLDGRKDYAPKGKYTIKDMIAWLKKQGKNEPRFKVGDWIINKSHDICLITDIDLENGYYICESNRFGNTDGDIDMTDKVFHLWSIQDAKDGDVLCCESGWTCIFKTLNSDNVSFSSYCFMDKIGWFCETGSDSHTLEKAFIKAYNGNIYPATKEQRDLLFQKMKESGYVWDAERKELEKTEQKPNFCHHEIDFSGCSEEYRKAYYDGWNNCNQQHAQLEAEQKPDWSEEDESMLKTIFDSLNTYTENGHPCLKSVVKDEIDWLKSLKDRYTWKPSDEQMAALSDINLTGGISYAGQGQELINLYNDLMKLKG